MCGIFRASLNLLWKNRLGGPYKVSLTLNEISRTCGILDRCIKSFCEYGDFKPQRTQSTLKRSLFLLKAFLMSSLNLSSCPIHIAIKILYSLSNSLLHILCLLLLLFLLSFESPFSQLFSAGSVFQISHISISIPWALSLLKCHAFTSIRY